MLTRSMVRGDSVTLKELPWRETLCCGELSVTLIMLARFLIDSLRANPGLLFDDSRFLRGVR